MNLYLIRNLIIIEVRVLTFKEWVRHKNQLELCPYNIKMEGMHFKRFKDCALIA